MKNVLAKTCGVLILILIASCGTKAISSTEKSFSQNRKSYERIVEKITFDRDKLKKTKQNLSQLEYTSISKDIENEFNPIIVSTDPLVILFMPDETFITMWYAETIKSVKSITSHPIVEFNDLKVFPIDGKWYLVKRRSSE
jgi:hypothetical protein